MSFKKMSLTILSHGQVNILSDKLQWEEFEKAFLVIERYFMYSKKNLITKK
jgi:hypothetical protein